MAESSGFNIEDLVNASPLNGGGAAEEPKVEHFIDNLRRTQQGKRALEEEIKEIKGINDSLQKELATLQTESYQLEQIQKEKEELCSELQFKCEESEQDLSRQLNQNKKIEERLQQYRCEIQEFKLKQRKQRMRFENQLHQLIEQHKNLHSSFSPERLPGEIESIKITISQLLSVEQKKLAQLNDVSEKLEEMKKQKPSQEE